MANIFYVGLNLFYTLDPYDLRTVRDARNNKSFASLQFVKCGTKEGIPDIGDIDPILISFVYSKTTVAL